jgi:hypothetical protein
MKKLFIAALVVLSSYILNAQKTDLSQRKCGSEFAQVGLSGKTFSEALDFVGQTHNDCQDYVLGYLSTIRGALNDTNELIRIISAQKDDFFRNKGIDPSRYPTTLDFRPGIQDIAFLEDNYSSSGVRILTQLRTAIQTYDGINNAQLSNVLSSLKHDALNLSDEKEVFTVGVPVAIAEYSFNYWKDKAQSWADILVAQNGAAEQNGKTVKTQRGSGCRIGLGQLGVADVLGGIRGATGGGIGGGPLGALAGGLIVGSMSSTGNIAGQLLGCLFSWW